VREEKLSQIGSILTRHTCNQGGFHSFRRAASQISALMIASVADLVRITSQKSEVVLL